MCEDAGPGSCNLVRGPAEELMKFRGSTYGKGTTFGLPVVEVDGVQVSQSVASTILAGETLGFGQPVTSTPKAMQLMLDMRDLVSALKVDSINPAEYASLNQTFDALISPPTGPAAAMSSVPRMDQFLSHLERNAAGPYFFPGTVPSYVDYYLISMFAWAAAQLKGKRTFPGKLLEPYPKLKGIVTLFKR